MSKPRTDMPKPAPFPVGTRVRYLGTHDVSSGPTGGEMRRIIYPGIEVTISKCAYGRKGTGRPVCEDDETGETLYDETKDFVSVYSVGPDVPGMHYGRCIGREDAHEWEVI
jgi:hypothetical protein